VVRGGALVVQPPTIDDRLPTAEFVGEAQRNPPVTGLNFGYHILFFLFFVNCSKDSMARSNPRPLGKYATIKCHIGHLLLSKWHKTFMVS
jgi:hypothetical protein